MPNSRYFRYRAVEANSGETLQGTMQAATQAEVIARLQQEGHLPISAEAIDPRAAGLRWPRFLRRRQSGISKSDLALFTRELATLTQAGLPLDTALRTLSRLDLSAAMQKLVARLLERIQGGMSLSEALAEHGDSFDKIYLNMVRAAEAGGALETVIARLAEYLERMAQLRAQALTATIYPAILFGFCIVSVLVLMTFVVPRFIPLFAGVEQTLPLITQAVFALSGLLRQYGWLLLLLLGGVALLVERRLANPAARLRWDQRLLRLPGIGRLTQEIEMARFARALGTAVANGVPLLSALRIVREVITNRAITKAMDEVITSLEQGRGMAAPLREAGVCPELALQLIEIGEASGQLDAMLTKIADIYDQQTQTTLRRMLTILEPALILGLGGLIALIILSILLAVLGLNEIVV